MKKLTFFLLALLLVLAVNTYAAGGTKKSSGYDHTIVYEGPFKATKLFVRGHKTGLWYPIKPLTSIDKVRCPEAYRAMQSGTWTGNLADDGQCADPEEGSEWTTGNYLNFLSARTKRP